MSIVRIGVRSRRVDVLGRPNRVKVTALRPNRVKVTALRPGPAGRSAYA